MDRIRQDFATSRRKEKGFRAAVKEKSPVLQVRVLLVYECLPI